MLWRTVYYLLLYYWVTLFAYLTLGFQNEYFDAMWINVYDYSDYCFTESIDLEKPTYNCSIYNANDLNCMYVSQVEAWNCIWLIHISYLFGLGSNVAFFFVWLLKWTFCLGFMMFQVFSFVCSGLNQNSLVRFARLMVWFWVIWLAMYYIIDMVWILEELRIELIDRET